MRHSSSRAEGFTTSLEVAAAVLVLGALMYLFMAWRYPLAPRGISGSSGRRP